MYADKLNSIIVRETEALNKLLSLLDEQHTMLIKNDIFGLEGMVEKIQTVNKEIAELEVERRKETSGSSISEIVNEANNEELDNNYRNIKKVLFNIELQKDSNETLIKQGLGFSTRMMNILVPNDRNTKTYNSYGKMRR